MASLCLPIQQPIRTTEPTLLQEPVTVAEARHQCGISDDITYHDEALYRLIAAARQQVEHDTGIVCYSGTFTWKLTSFHGTIIELPGVRPVTSITSITYIDTAGDSQTLATSVYGLEANAVKPYVYLKHLQSWPALRGDINGIVVTLVAGYSSVLTVPGVVKDAVLLALHVMWLRHMENLADADMQQQGYDREIGRIARSSYP